MPWPYAADSSKPPTPLRELDRISMIWYKLVDLIKLNGIGRRQRLSRHT